MKKKGRTHIKKLILLGTLLLFIGLVACGSEQDETVTIDIIGGDVEIELGAEYVDQGATATTSSGETLNVQAAHSVNTDEVGTYEVVYTTEFNDTVYEKTRYVEVIDPATEDGDS